MEFPDVKEQNPGSSKRITPVAIYTPLVDESCVMAAFHGKAKTICEVIKNSASKMLMGRLDGFYEKGIFGKNVGTFGHKRYKPNRDGEVWFMRIFSAIRRKDKA